MYISIYIYIYIFGNAPSPSIHLPCVNTMVFCNFGMIDFSAFFIMSLHKIIPGHIFKIGDLLDF